jgi:rod shape-determining protein MreC
MKKKKGTSKTVALCLGAILCFFIVQRSLKSEVGSFDKIVSSLAFPFVQAQHMMIDPLVRFYVELKRRSFVDAAYKTVVQERDDLQAQLLELKATKNFAEETEEVRLFKDQYKNSVAVLVRVLMRQSGSAGNFFLVEGGEDRGIHKDTPVVYKNCLVGKVTEVCPYYSKVVLISDPNCKVAAYCDVTGTQGIYQGAQEGLFGALTHVGHLSELQEGDTVFSSGEGMIFPRGFGIGTVSSFVKNEGDMQYTIAITPFLDFSVVDYCYVLEKETLVDGL